jgi:hypothetical protein
MRNGLRLGLCPLVALALAAGLRAEVPTGPSPKKPESGGFRWPWEKKPEKPAMPKPPSPPPGFPAEPFTIELLDPDEGVRPVLQVTPNFYKALRKIAMDEVPSDGRATAAAELQDETPPFRWAVAGAALALALGAGGLWLLRAGGSAWKSRLSLLLIVTAAGALGGAVVIATPPLKPQPKPVIDMKAQLPPLPPENRLTVQLLDQKSDAVRLRVSRAYLEKLLEASKPAPPVSKKVDGPILPPPPTDFPPPPR